MDMIRLRELLRGGKSVAAAMEARSMLGWVRHLGSMHVFVDLEGTRRSISIVAMFKLCMIMYACS